jgi:transposase
MFLESMHLMKRSENACSRWRTRIISSRSMASTVVGRALRRYKRRWIVERTIGWLDNFRRLVIRYDRSLKVYGAFFHIACFIFVLRRVVQ